MVLIIGLIRIKSIKNPGRLMASPLCKNIIRQEECLGIGFFDCIPLELKDFMWLLKFEPKDTNIKTKYKKINAFLDTRLKLPMK